MEHKTNKQLLEEIEQLKAEKKNYNKNQEIFRIIAENAVDNIAIISFNLKAKFLYISPSIKRSLGFEPSELLGKSFFDYIHPEDKEFILKLLKEYINQVIKSIIKPGDPNIIEILHFAVVARIPFRKAIRIHHMNN